MTSRPMTKPFSVGSYWVPWRGTQYRYLIPGLALGLALLVLLKTALLVLQTQAYQTVLGQAGGLRVWMDAPIGIEQAELEDAGAAGELDLGVGRALGVYPYTDITAEAVALPGRQGKRDGGLRGRLIPGNHPLRVSLQPAAGPREEVLELGFLGALGRSSRFLGEDTVLSESPQAVAYLSLRAIPGIDWQAQIHRAPTFLKPDYQVLDRMARDCWLAELLRMPAGVKHLYGEGGMPTPVLARCGLPPPGYLNTFTAWRERLVSGGNRRSGIFLEKNEWIRILWIRDIPLPGGFDYLMGFALGQALKLQARAGSDKTRENGDMFADCHANPGSVYDEVRIVPNDEPLAVNALHECLAPCFEEGGSPCRLETTPYDELKLTGPHLHPAWLANCPALADRQGDISPGNQPSTVSPGCPDIAASQVDVYLPDYGALPEAKRRLRAKWGMAPGSESPNLLATLGALMKTLEGMEQAGLIALMIYLGAVFLQVRQRRDLLEEARARGLSTRHILVGGIIADFLSWTLSAVLGLGVAGVVTLLAMGVGPWWEYYARGVAAAMVWLGAALLLQLFLGVVIHWYRVSHTEPAGNLKTVA
uniref:FtsX-like permease family protein n=1 Tax=Candidatus Kentrum sp. FM TaxID=2126340 RepID=A0A450SNZ4_9GAMM|nr:MAG: hypothetical protein BECKFM1743A_GA0114220_101433 [Candidatus Kentron sp. FM]VFJ55588.1 MAG: hypothetical protein BECKFM1743C_GA0114222_101603 [Candidatus Kentron sp. FM]VFK10647.1 MAG: hypothetical protein BECKFM1743B_GA0114221_101483 [Candidatus Kentron sp. FM]